MGDVNPPILPKGTRPADDPNTDLIQITIFTNLDATTKDKWSLDGRVARAGLFTKPRATRSPRAHASLLHSICVIVHYISRDPLYFKHAQT